MTTRVPSSGKGRTKTPEVWTALIGEGEVSEGGHKDPQAHFWLSPSWPYHTASGLPRLRPCLYALLCRFCGLRGSCGLQEDIGGDITLVPHFFDLILLTSLSISKERSGL